MAHLNVFPTARGYCTKMPIKLRMSNTLLSGGTSRCTIRFPGMPDEVLNLDYNQEPAPEPAERIRLYMERIVDGRGGGVVMQELEVELCSPEVPNLEVIDLPGIVASPPDLAQATVHLTRRYLGDRYTLVLCMVPASTPSLRTSQAIAMVEQTPGAKARTIVALTMW